MKKIIIANWKMNPSSLKKAKQIFNEIKKVAGRMSRVETVICPPFVYLSSLTTQDSRLKTGSQNIFWLEKGAYTGEISASMLKDLGVKYVIIGHSEKRELGETDEIINKKIKTALKSGLKVIFCIGEKERDIDNHFLNFIKDQISNGLKGIQKKFFKNLIIAYEPVWAISSHQGASADNPESALRVAIFIRRMLLEIVGGQLARQIPILYGGSVDAKNAREFLHNNGMQGLLVGSKSLVPKEFGEILKIASKV